MNYTYLLLDTAVISIPFLASFYPKAAFYKTWPALLKALLLTGAFFIIWDVFFTVEGIWGFNTKYLTGIELLHLPIEEWLFFVAVPYACTFTFFAFRHLIKNDPFEKSSRWITLFLFSLSVALCITHFGKHYTFFTSLFTAVFLGLSLWKWNFKWMGWLYLTYLVILIPFTISNGVLTGLYFWEYPLFHLSPEMVTDQVVWYNNDHNIGIRFFSIPIDDILYGFLLVAMNIAWYQHFREKALTTS